MDYQITEPFLQERVEKAKEKAKKMIHGVADSEGDLFLIYSFILAQRYNMPIYSDYFLERSIDELAFEVFLWKELDNKIRIGTQDFKLDEQIMEQAQDSESWADLQSDDDFLKQASSDFDNWQPME